MPTMDFSHLTPKQRLDPDDVPLTPEQEAEIDRRLETLDEDIKHGIDADELEAELDRRYK